MQDEVFESIVPTKFGLQRHASTSTAKPVVALVVALAGHGTQKFVNPRLYISIGQIRQDIVFPATGLPNPAWQSMQLLPLYPNVHVQLNASTATPELVTKLSMHVPPFKHGELSHASMHLSLSSLSPMQSALLSLSPQPACASQLVEHEVAA